MFRVEQECAGVWVTIIDTPFGGTVAGYPYAVFADRGMANWGMNHVKRFVNVRQRVVHVLEPLGQGV